MKGLVRAINRALKETMADPNAAIELLAQTEPLINKDIEKRRLIYVYKTLIDTPEARALGIGDASDARLDSVDRDDRRILQSAAHAEGERSVRPLVPAAESRPYAGHADELTGRAGDPQRTPASLKPSPFAVALSRRPAGATLPA